jgi:integration host factor subunit alpha
MAGRTVTRVDLVEAVRQRGRVSRTEAAEMVDAVLREVSDTLASGESVKLHGFGSFIVRSKRKRIGRNPKTGVEVAIEPRQVVMFQASPVLKAHMNGDQKEAPSAS